MKYVSVQEVIAIEKEADASGHSYASMMEHAGRGLAEVIHEAYGYREGKSALALVGSGNNGGDALVALDYLASWDWEVTAFVLRARKEDDALVKRVVQAGGSVLAWEEGWSAGDVEDLFCGRDVVIDGVLGTGIHLPVRGELGNRLDVVRGTLEGMEKRPAVVAVDCPSGVDTDSGQVDPVCIPADVTVTMAAVKQGLLKFPAFRFLGDLRVVEIGLPEGLDSYDSIQREVVDGDWVKRVLPDRPLNSHKGTFGTALIVAGSQPYPGAAALCARGAYRVGTGLVTVALPDLLHPALAGALTEPTWIPLPHQGGYLNEKAADVLMEKMGRESAVLLGPGFGQLDSTAGFLRRFLEMDQLPPLVVDADGLKLLTRISGWQEKLPSLSVLTPHPGEMAVISGWSVKEIQDDRVGCAERFAAEWGHVVVLKGAHTVIASPGGETKILPLATSALASAGTGDVLAGVIVGLIAQGTMPFQAAAAGAWLHAQAGITAADRLGNEASVMAGDVAHSLVDVLSWWGK